ncbi:MAG: hypothetical protein ACK56F_00805, partial [bacterium]
MGFRGVGGVWRRVGQGWGFRVRGADLTLEFDMTGQHRLGLFEHICREPSTCFLPIPFVQCREACMHRDQAVVRRSGLGMVPE